MAKQSKKQEKKRLIRIPINIDKNLEKRALENRRSVNSQIIHELQENERGV